MQGKRNIIDVTSMTVDPGLTVLAAGQDIHKGGLASAAGAHERCQDARLEGAGDALQELQLLGTRRLGLQTITLIKRMCAKTYYSAFTYICQGELCGWPSAN